ELRDLVFVSHDPSLRPDQPVRLPTLPTADLPSADDAAGAARADDAAGAARADDAAGAARAAPAPGGAASRRDSTTSTTPASAIPATRSPSLTGSAGMRSWNSQVPASTKYTLLATLDTGMRMDARQACSAAWYSSSAAAEHPPS